MFNRAQYNEAVGRTHLVQQYGPGAIKHTTWGVIMPQNIEQWRSIRFVRENINKLAGNSEEDRRKELQLGIRNAGLKLIKDNRFISFLKHEKGYSNLFCLLSVPAVQLNNSNYFQNYAERENLPATAVHFPKYFYDPDFKGKKTNLKSYAEWKQLYQNSFGRLVNDNNEALRLFVPPKTHRSSGEANTNAITEAQKRRKLIPVPLIFICDRGHITDIPWAKLLHVRSMSKGEQDGLMQDLHNAPNCCEGPDLVWEGSNLSDPGFEGINISCNNCKRRRAIGNLSDLSTRCNGHRPWEFPVTHENCDATMRYAITTANNLYYSQCVDSLYIPDALSENPIINKTVLDQLEQLHANSAQSKEEFIKGNSGLLSVLLKDAKVRKDTVNAFRNGVVSNNNPKDSAALKAEEFNAFFTNQQFINKEEPDLVFDAVQYSNENAIAGDFIILDKFDQVRRIDNLKLTKLQLSFTRVVPLDPDAIDLNEDGNQVRPIRIHKEQKQNVQVLPAVESFGEGIFVSLDTQKIAEWEKKVQDIDLWSDIEDKEQIISQIDNPYLQSKASNLSLRFLLVHTLAHILIKEFEFSCGYPAASLSERIYVKEGDGGMAGFLIYTTEGSQGSMGGLTSQAKPQKLFQLIERALVRASDCPSDPICWQAEGLVNEKLSGAACFSCADVSETSCEYQNLMLDRRILVDDLFGFFRSDSSEYLINSGSTHEQVLG
ncbi:DUF1998 domain-containing protein [Rufibacter tibetensis]|uniref:MrfA-like Zn-binding domain-containing protein n=1 Tax=Rufibacter tibetensis TaxID=512763 RepID=A0A0P0C4M1_9BACT|nr:DUF1998 domain-containing protein [Rufibacter tibetensis]ALI98085.1 hypothetical protein DC20_02715 [Rufibacter tibetensis]